MNFIAMKKTSLIALLLGAFAVVGGCSSDDPPKGAADEHGDGAEAGEHADDKRGPHGGRLFEDGDATLELAIYEQGVPPEFRAWVTKAGKPVAPTQAQLSIELKRFGNATEAVGHSGMPMLSMIPRSKRASFRW